MNVSKRTLKGLDLGDSAKVLEKKMTFFFAQPQVPCRGPAGGPLGWKKHKYLQKKQEGASFYPLRASPSV